MQVPIITLFPVQSVQCPRRRRYADALGDDFVSELKSSLFVSLDHVSNSDNIELNSDNIELNSHPGQKSVLNSIKISFFYHFC